MRSVGRTIACGVMTICLGPMGAEGAEFKLRPNIAVDGRLNDNLFLVPANLQPNQNFPPKLSVWQATVYPGLSLRYHIGAFSLDSTASAAINRYIDHAEFNTEDQTYRLTSRYDFGRQQLNLNFRYSQIATLRTELADTGELQGFARQRERISVNPNWQYALSEVSRLSLGYTFSQQSYTDPTGNVSGVTPLIGSTQNGGNILLDYSLTTRLRLGSEFTYSNVAGDTGNVTDSYMLRFPVRYDYSETFRTSANVGARYVEVSNNGSGGSGDAGFLFGFTFFEKFDIGQIDLTLGRDVVPSGYGTQRQMDNVLLGLTANLSDTVFAGLRTRFIRNEQLGGDSTSSSSGNRDFFEVSPNLRWQWAENWALNAGYVLRIQKRDGVPGTAYGNLIFMSIGYSFEDLFLE